MADRAGITNAGLVPAGVGLPLAPTPPPLPRQAWGMPCFDLGTKQITQNSDGTFQSIHAVDLRMRMALGIVLGSIPSAPEVGCAKGPARQTQQSKAEHVAVMTTAVASIVANGDVKILGFRVDQSVPGRTVRYCEYVNLRLPGSKPEVAGGPV